PDVRSRRHYNRQPAPGMPAKQITAILAEDDRHRAGPAYLASGPRHNVWVLQPEVRDALQPFLDRDAHLHPGEVRAGAAVDAYAKGDVRVDRAVDDDFIGVGELLRVAVGGREVH